MTSTQDSAGESRWRRIVLGGLSAGAARVIGIACNLLVVPLLLQTIGTEGFGVWATLQAIAQFLPTLDGGTGFRLQNTVTHALAVNRPGDIGRELRVVIWLTCGMGILMAMIVLAIDARMWACLLGLESPALHNTLGPHLGQLLALGCAQLPTTLGVRLATALQRTWLIGVTQSGISLLTFAIAAAAASVPISAAALLGALLAVPVLINGALTLWLARELAPGDNLLRPPTPAAGSAALRQGLPFLVPQLLGSLRLTAPPVILASLLGASAVTPFNLVQRVLSLVAQPISWVLDPLWPAYADAASRHDFAWIRRTFRLSLLMVAGVAAAPLLSTLGWTPHFITWWTRGAVPTLPAFLVFWLVLWQIGIVLTHACSVCLNGLGRLRGQMLYGPPTVIVALAGMAWVAEARGIAWVAAPAAFATLLFNVPCTLLDVRAALRQMVATSSVV